MSDNEIKLRTIQHINGIGYLAKKQTEELNNIICGKLNIELNKSNIEAIQYGITAYFEMQNSMH